MPELERHAVDAVADDLIRVYALGAKRLESIIAAGLRRGLSPGRAGTPAQQRGDATAAYRARSLERARAILAELLRDGTAKAPVTAANAYGAGVLAIDRTIAETRLTGTFGWIHQRQVEVYAGNLTRSIEAATGRTTANVEAVFARAAMIDGALPPEGLDAVPRFIGRRVDDPWRRIALETLARGTVSLDTRKQISRALAGQLTREGVTDALTGFVDGAGRRWTLDRYVEMVARTTTREAASRAAVERLREQRVDLVAITSHPHKADECDEFDGKTFTLSGADPRYPRLRAIPPFHPYCRHVLGPAGGSLDDYERELERGAGQLSS